MSQVSTESPSSKSGPKPRHPLYWVPSLYLAMGLPNVTVGVVAAILYKNMGISNQDIALYTSQMYLPWVLKPLWAPFLEPFKTKRWWVISMEFAMMASLGMVAFSLPLDGFFRLSLAFFWITGFASATQDIVADGVYMTTMKRKDQARYAGVQGMCWNLGAVIASGLLVTLTGWLRNGLELSWAHCWMIVMGGTALAMGGFGLWHLKTLPVGEVSPLAGQKASAAWPALKKSWVSFFQKPQIWMMLTVVFFYRFGEGFIEKFGPLFMLDPREVGGLGLDNEALGYISGTVGTIAFIAGAFLGGFLVARLSLKRSFFLLALILNVPNATYFILSQTLPDNLYVIGGIVALEKFGFGMGSVGHMLYMMQQLAPGPFKMTHYAFATGVMAMTRWSTGSLSGWVYSLCGENYSTFFVFVLLASVPPIVLAWMAPFPLDHEEE
ncbi:MFS transporter [Pelagicoccus albus]|uniref:MFS transporter n=1 Tax=Pelagicoccus albus TaxID=415222 RepID=A0A7X1B633_9BACT|nr:MFS transporter [Pelagicoccus albus]MBC2605203.1 MFS transporter [Pelagicoccus albus]